jgi:hypothetical protein
MVFYGRSTGLETGHASKESVGRWRRGLSQATVVGMMVRVLLCTFADYCECRAVGIGHPVLVC